MLKVIVNFQVERVRHMTQNKKEFIRVNGYSPSYEELKQLNNMKSKSNVHAYVQSLKKRGYLDDIPYSKRSIVVLP